MTNGNVHRQRRRAAGLTSLTDGERAGRLRRRHAVRDAVAEIKLARGCVDCGYRDHAEALDFDHLPGVLKVAEVSALIKNKASLAKVLLEIEKCEVVCANCHRVRTATRRT